MTLQKINQAVLDLEPAVDMTVSGLTSEHSRVAYSKALNDFLDWFLEYRGPLNKQAVQTYIRFMDDRGLAPSTINLRVSAIKRMMNEAADNGLVDPVLAQGIAKVKGIRTAGVRAGNWLTLAEAQALLHEPDITALKGLRDRAILAALMGCGLRRSEAADLTLEQIQQRESRWVIADLVGKGNRVRTVPMPSWCKMGLDAWTGAVGIADGRVFRAINKAGNLAGRRKVRSGLYSDGFMSAQGIADVVRAYAPPGIAAHDLRRTWAKLAHKGGAALEQIQLSLGHASIQTTEAYLGVDQDLSTAPADLLGLNL